MSYKIVRILIAMFTAIIMLSSFLDPWLDRWPWG